MKTSPKLPNVKTEKLNQEDNDLLIAKQKKEIEEKKSMEKMFSGSCCHSGVHASNFNRG